MKTKVSEMFVTGLIRCAGVVAQLRYASRGAVEPDERKLTELDKSAGESIALPTTPPLATQIPALKQHRIFTSNIKICT